MMPRRGTGNKAHRRQLRQQGMTLLEVLAVAVIMLVCFNICMSLFITNFRLASLGHTALDRLDQLEETETLFRETVRPATDFAEAVGDYRAGEDCLILCYPSLNDMPRYVVVGALGEGDQVRRMELGWDGAAWECLDFRTFPAHMETIQFVTTQSPNGSAQAALAFSLKKDMPSRRESTRHYIQATLRGR